jgi:CRISPR-associated protein Csa1
MYYLDEVEIKKLTKDLLRRTKESPVSEALRGWNWAEEPLRPYSDTLLLPVWEVATDICPTRRDVWLRRELRKSIPTSFTQARGFVIHHLVSFIFQKAKKFVYQGNLEFYDELKEMAEEELERSIENISKDVKMSDNSMNFLRDFGKRIISWETRRIGTKIEEVLSKYPYLNEETLVNLALPVVTEMIVDGSLLGLSKCLKMDATNLFGGIIFDLKVGRKEEWHKVQVAGYALAFESFFERAVDIGCVVYVNFVNNRIKVEREFFIISDKLRSSFLERRDYIQMMLLRKKEPKVAEKCPQNCIFKGWLCMK